MSLPARLLAVVDPKLVNPIVNTTVFPTKALVVFALLPMARSVLPVVSPAREKLGAISSKCSAMTKKICPIFNEETNWLMYANINLLFVEIELANLI